VRANRELPVVWAVAKGSLVNKAILVPAALAISAFAPWAIVPLLMLGGLFLCYEGFEKIWHRLAHRDDAAAHRAELREALEDPAVDLRTLERDKIKGAVRTDFILSAEIIVIALGAVAASPLATRVGVLVGIAIIMTVGVYGLVAGIVKLDDAGLHLARSGSAAVRWLGRGILWFAPWLMKFLSLAGTAAMFLVGGGILTHGIPALHHLVTDLAVQLAAAGGRWLGTFGSLLADALTGVVAGAAVLAVVALAKKAWPARAAGGTA
jgi:predicted DNA repair protein MutK